MFGKIFKIINVIAIIIVAILLALYAYSMHLADEVITNEDIDIKPFSLLIMGTDEDNPDAEGARTDVLMVVTFNLQNSRGNLEVNTISIPRDTIVYNTCTGYYDKINAAYDSRYNISEDAATECTVSTVENYLNIPIDYYISTSFDGLVELIDKIGGIKINVPYTFSEQDSNGVPDSITIQEGEQELDGEEALAYARQRKNSSDYERIQRQKQVISAIIKKVLNNPVKYTSNIIAVYDDIFNTNIDADVITKIINSFATLYNDASIALANGNQVLVDITNSKYSEKTTFTKMLEEDLNFDEKKLYTKDINKIYDEVNDVEENVDLSRYALTKKNLNLATSYNEEAKDDLLIEFESYTMKAEDFQSAVLGYASYPLPSTLVYTSNMLRTSLNLDLEYPSYDYEALSTINGPSIYEIVMTDNERYHDNELTAEDYQFIQENVVSPEDGQKEVQKLEEEYKKLE